MGTTTITTPERTTPVTTSPATTAPATTAPTMTTTTTPEGTTTTTQEATSESSTIHPMTGCKNQLCESNGLFAGPEPCSPDFCHCSWGVPHPTICQQGTVFNSDIGVCDWPWNTQECSSM